MITTIIIIINIMIIHIHIIIIIISGDSRMLLTARRTPPRAQLWGVPSDGANFILSH